MIPSRGERKFYDRLWSKVDTSEGLPGCWPWTSGKDQDGYGQVFRDGNNLKPHRLVCEWAHGPCPMGMECRHLCGFSGCCNPLHLAWGTKSNNARDKIAHGTHNRGERCRTAKLTDRDVHAIREHIANGETQRTIAESLGVSRSLVGHVATGRSWAHLPTQP